MQIDTFLFRTEDDDGEVFQVKKSSHSKKVMRMMDKERRKKKHRDHDSGAAADAQEPRSNNNNNNNGCGRQPSERDAASSAACVKGVGNDDCADVKRQKSSNATNSSVHTEIRTDDFVVRLLLYQVLCCLNAWRLPPPPP